MIHFEGMESAGSVWNDAGIQRIWFSKILIGQCFICLLTGAQVPRLPCPWVHLQSVRSAAALEWWALPLPLEVWPFPNASTTWQPVMSTSPTTSCAAMNTGKPLTSWPRKVKVGWFLRYISGFIVQSTVCDTRFFFRLQAESIAEQ